MKHLAALLLALLWSGMPGTLRAETKFPVAGKLYMQVDDAVGIWQNGTNVHHGKIGTSESKLVNLMPGDRLVIHLWNKGGPRGFKMIFVSEDRKTAINFTPGMFRILRDPDKKDFTAKEFAEWKETAHAHKRIQGDHIAFKNTAPWFWGEKTKGDCYVAGMITKEMFEVFKP